jgi:GH15 family glucan-1,4-alpha-glucosidase
MESKVQALKEISREVILDCALENGAVVAANGSKDYFPKEANYYTYVWPRDASFTCVAADILKIDGIQNKFFDWCLNRAEGFRESGLFYEKYFTSGLKANSAFQPDQTGSVLWAFWHHFKDNPDEARKYELLISKAAEGICGKWTRTHFAVVTNDLWEERFTFPDLMDNFTYSLAACIKGLESADSFMPNKNWIKTAQEMRERLESHYESFFLRSFGRLSDKRVDASMLGLVYPFEIISPSDERIISTVKEMEKRVVINGGVHRYEHDEYDGWIRETMCRKKGSGAWPLLNFWMAVYYARLGNQEKATKYYRWVLDRTDKFIPEQIFENNIQISVSPLCWSHAMFIIASRELGYF